ncbi:MAG: hypothetical protein FJZ58_07120 [Chlamydiae bacterium]|nr:hypothetical protein [Chlamydiota bacterium]
MGCIIEEQTKPQEDQEAGVKQARMRALTYIGLAVGAVAVGQYVIGSIILTAKIAVVAGVTYVIVRPYLDEETRESGDAVAHEVATLAYQAVIKPLGIDAKLQAGKEKLVEAKQSCEHLVEQCRESMDDHILTARASWRGVSKELLALEDTFGLPDNNPRRIKALSDLTEKTNEQDKSIPLLQRGWKSKDRPVALNVVQHLMNTSGGMELTEEEQGLGITVGENGELVAGV